MGAGHGHRLHYHGHSGRPSDCPRSRKIIALVLFVLAVVATPRTTYWAYGIDAVALARGHRWSRRCRSATSPSGWWSRSRSSSSPLLLPFIALGPRTEFLGLSVSESGLEDGLTLLCKATLGVVAGLRSPRPPSRAT